MDGKQLLYQVHGWHILTCIRNSEDGFVSGRFAKALVEPRPPPLCNQLEWNDVAQHLNNAGMDQTGTPSPFISTSNLFICQCIHIQTMFYQHG